jgi:hypothetical protein
MVRVSKRVVLLVSALVVVVLSFLAAVVGRGRPSGWEPFGWRIWPEAILVALGAGLAFVVVLIVLLWPRIWGWLQAPAVEAARMRVQVSAADVELKDRLGLRKDLLQIENATRGMVFQGAGTFVQSLGLLGLAITLLGTCASLQVAEENLRATQAKLEIDREGLITDRFNKATEHLGAVSASGQPSVHVRIGGIYALERIARNATTADGDYRSVMEVLTAYLRERAPLGESRPCLDDPTDAQRSRSSGKVPPEDVQAVLTVIGRRKWTAESGELSSPTLSYTNLRGASLTSAPLHKAALIGTYMEGIALNGAHLDEALLAASYLEGAYMARSHLKGASLRSVCLTGADLTGADLTGADLTGADLKGAILKDADLKGAILKDVRGLTREQLNQAVTDQRTVLPDGLR